MENTIVGTFLKSGNPVAENERVTYLFQGSGNELYGNLEISQVKKDDSGVYTCVAYKAGIVVTREFVLKAGKIIEIFKNSASNRDKSTLIILAGQTGLYRFTEN